MSRVLSVTFIDDEVDIHKLFELHLRKLVRSGEIEIRSFYSADEFLKSVDDAEGIIITDINMPGMDGIDLCQKLSNQRSDLRVYVASAYSSQDFITKAKDSGAIEFLEKPIDFSRLKKIIKEEILFKSSQGDF